MTARVLLFGSIRQAVGESEMKLPITAGTDAAQAFMTIVERFPAMSRHKLLFAINQQYATGSETINDGDEIAIFTPVSGG